MSAKCSKCGATVNGAYCEFCGNELKIETAASTQSAAAAVPVQVVVAPPPQTFVAPVGQLKTNRGLVKFILLSIITLGIYSLVYYSSISNDINIIASRYDGKKTMHYCLLLFFFSWLTGGIAILVWSHRISNRIGGELSRRGLNYRFGASSYWLWSILGTLIIVGPFIYIYRLSKACNTLAKDYNARG